ncbi:putative LOC100569746 [Trichonephila clavipes]|nr:putative LOC100569746 [Trichonephila clavipes]
MASLPSLSPTPLDTSGGSLQYFKATLWLLATDIIILNLDLVTRKVSELAIHLRTSASRQTRATIDLLKDTFGDCQISRFGPVNWPPRSCDLTSLDYFLWGYVKSLVYADKPQTLDHLEDNIRRVIADIRPQMLEKVIENWMSRLDYIQASHGSHMSEIIHWPQKVKEAKTRHRVSLVSAHVTTLEEDLKQQPSVKIVTKMFYFRKLAIPFVPNRDPPDTPQQSELGEVMHYHPSE